MPKALGNILTVSILIGGCVFYSPSLPCVCRHFAILPRCGVGILASQYIFGGLHYTAVSAVVASHTYYSKLKPKAKPKVRITPYGVIINRRPCIIIVIDIVSDRAVSKLLL